MTVATYLLWFGIAVSSVLQNPVAGQEPCSSYTTLSEQWRSVLVTSGGYSHDAFAGWYRFSGAAGDRMLDYWPVWKSGVYRCNAQGHGYLTGGHPRGSEGVVSRTVCFAYSGSGCWHSTSIQVKNCGSYFVYYLNNLYGIWTSNRVSLRYCGAGEVGESLKNRYI